jgi:hypothetical protein
VENRRGKPQKEIWFGRFCGCEALLEMWRFCAICDLWQRMEIGIERFAAVAFFVVGLSHVVQPRVWAQFFIALREKGPVGSFIIALIQFPMGALIVAFHNIFHGIPLVLTLIGYGLVIKSLIYFVFPSVGMRSLSRVSIERSWEFVVAGIFSIGISGLLAYSMLTR